VLELTPEGTDGLPDRGPCRGPDLDGGGTLRWAYLDTEWLRKQAAQLLPNRADDKRMVLTAPGAAVRAFVAKFGVDDKAHGMLRVAESAVLNMPIRLLFLALIGAVVLTAATPLMWLDPS